MATQNLPKEYINLPAVSGKSRRIPPFKIILTSLCFLLLAVQLFSKFMFNLDLWYWKGSLQSSLFEAGMLLEFAFTVLVLAMVFLSNTSKYKSIWWYVGGIFCAAVLQLFCVNSIDSFDFFTYEQQGNLMKLLILNAVISLFTLFQSIRAARVYRLSVN